MGPAEVPHYHEVVLVAIVAFEPLGEGVEGVGTLAGTEDRVVGCCWGDEVLGQGSLAHVADVLPEPVDRALVSITQR